MKWVIAEGWHKDNPVGNIGQVLPKQRGGPVHRKALPYAEVGECLRAVRGSGAWIGTKLAFQYAVLTAARSGEVRHATWNEIGGAPDGGDILNADIWSIPAERMKMNKPHRVPLSWQAVAVLGQARRLKGSSDLLFPSSRGRALSDMTLSKLLRELGFEAHMHGFRTSFRTWVQEQTDVSGEVAELALAHVNRDRVEAAYARSDLFDRRRMLMQRWGDYLTDQGAWDDG